MSERIIKVGGPLDFMDMMEVREEYVTKRDREAKVRTAAASQMGEALHQDPRELGPAVQDFVKAYSKRVLENGTPQTSGNTFQIDTTGREPYE